MEIKIQCHLDKLIHKVVSPIDSAYLNDNE